MKQVTLKIESTTEGHQTVTCSIPEAIEKITDEIGNKGKWLYCDGQYTSIETLTQNDRTNLARRLENANDITLASTLLGG